MRSSIISLFCDRASHNAARPVLQVRREGQFEWITWGELARDVRRAAVALATIGVQPGDRVVQISPNRHEWVVADLAIQMTLAVHVPVHAPLTGKQMAEQIADCGARVALLAGAKEVNKLAGVAEAAPRETAFASYDAVETRIGGAPVPRLNDLTADTSDAAADEIERRAVEQLGADSLATILYTSGTTGEPKGVMLTQGNLVSNTLAKIEAHGFSDDELRLGVLPLSHIFGRTCDLYVTLATGGRLALGGTRETFFDDCAAVGPTYVNGVPYFFDKCYRVARGASFRPAGRLEACPTSDGLRRLLGGRIQSCLCGGAPLPRHVYDFFWEQGVPVVEGYGLTESSPVISDCTLAHNKPGTVGRPIPGVEVRIAEDGEILTRGPHVMLGYWNQPEATAEVIRDGWLCTGDLGHLDEEGFLAITGRKKEILVTAAGRNVPPARIEALLTQHPLIAQALVVGEGRNYLAALIVPGREARAGRLTQQGMDLAAIKEIERDDRVRATLTECIDAQLADVAPYERVRRFAILDRPFSIERGELTAKQSLRRQVIAEHYAGVIERLYGERA